MEALNKTGEQRPQSGQAKVLIIDDDPTFCGMLTEVVEELGHQVFSSLTLYEGLGQIPRALPDVVFLDINLPDGDGLTALPEILNTPPHPEVIIITAESDPEGAELAVKSGAWDYISKPSSVGEMSLPLIRALQYRQEKATRQRPTLLKREGLVGSGPALTACLDQVAEAAQSDGSVLITGETGTGKELFAEAIHNNSSRAERSFVVVDCASLPETLVESILFGHEKGAFTGADRARDGLVKQADGGTLFLDEVGELPISLQKSFLRVLQERRFRRVGGSSEIDCDFRLVAATNRNLEEMTEAGLFRTDLLYRLRTFSLNLPPLRERKEDIAELSIYHLNRLSKRDEIGTKGISPEFFEILAGYEWPGNIRELVNTLDIARAAAANSPILYPHHLPTEIRAKVARSVVGQAEGGKGRNLSQTGPGKAMPSLKDVLEPAMAQVERNYLQELMDLTEGDLRQACAISGLSRTGLYDRLKKHNIPRSRRED